MPDSPIHDATTAAERLEINHEREKACVTAIQETLETMQAARTALQQSFGAPANRADTDLMLDALAGMQKADTSDQVTTYLASFDYLLNTTHPETTLLPINQCLDQLQALADLHEERFSKEPVSTLQKL